MSFLIFLLGLVACSLGAHSLPIAEYSMVMLGTIIIYVGGLIHD